EQDVLEELGRNRLRPRELLALDRALALGCGQLGRGPQRVVGLRGDTHGSILSQPDFWRIRSTWSARTTMRSAPWYAGSERPLLSSKTSTICIPKSRQRRTASTTARYSASERTWPVGSLLTTAAPPGTHRRGDRSPPAAPTR